MGGRAALEDQTSTPHHQPRRTSDTQVHAISTARQTLSELVHVRGKAAGAHRPLGYQPPCAALSEGTQ